MSDLITIEGFFQRVILKDEKSGRTLFSIIPEKVPENYEKALTKYGTIRKTFSRLWRRSVRSCTDSLSRTSKKRRPRNDLCTHNGRGQGA